MPYQSCSLSSTLSKIQQPACGISLDCTALSYLQNTSTLFALQGRRRKIHLGRIAAHVTKTLAPLLIAVLTPHSAAQMRLPPDRNGHLPCKPPNKNRWDYQPITWKMSLTVVKRGLAIYTTFYYPFTDPRQRQYTRCANTKLWVLSMAVVNYLNGQINRGPGPSVAIAALHGVKAMQQGLALHAGYLHG